MEIKEKKKSIRKLMLEQRRKLDTFIFNLSRVLNFVKPADFL